VAESSSLHDQACLPPILKQPSYSGSYYTCLNQVWNKQPTPLAGTDTWTNMWPNKVFRIIVIQTITANAFLAMQVSYFSMHFYTIATSYSWASCLYYP
jgi:hypothetical protein